MYVIYRRSEKEMPAEKEEIESAKKEGINFLFQNNIVKIIGKDKVENLELIKTELIEKEGYSRKVPSNILNSNFVIDIDYVIMALGGQVSEEVKYLKLKLNNYGKIDVDENYQTSNKKIFAGGDLINKKGSVAWASYNGREAAKNIVMFLGRKQFENE